MDPHDLAVQCTCMVGKRDTRGQLCAQAVLWSLHPANHTCEARKHWLQFYPSSCPDLRSLTTHAVMPAGSCCKVQTSKQDVAACCDRKTAEPKVRLTSPLC